MGSNSSEQNIKNNVPVKSMTNDELWATYGNLNLCQITKKPTNPRFLDLTPSASSVRAIKSAPTRKNKLKSKKLTLKQSKSSTSKPKSHVRRALFGPLGRINAGNLESIPEETSSTSWDTTSSLLDPTFYAQTPPPDSVIGNENTCITPGKEDDGVNPEDHG